jgi:hypothetical protein
MSVLGMLRLTASANHDMQKLTNTGRKALKGVFKAYWSVFAPEPQPYS